jgi:hypothetical protein
VAVVNPEVQRPGASDADPNQEEAVVEAVRKAVRDIEFGSVLVKIHQGRVVGIETSTKLRLDGATT